MTQRRVYQNEYPYFVTFRTKEGYPLFEEVKYARLISRVILGTCKIKCYDVLSYQIMPDHVHILVNKINPQAQPAVAARPSKWHATAGTAARVRGECFTVSDLMHGIKSFYCDQIRDQYGINYPIFQPRFYTRIITTRKYLRTVVQYIKHNPIKAALTHKYHRPPYQYFIWSLINRLF